MLERKDVTVGDLLVAIRERSTRIHPIVGRLYIVCSPIGYGTNAIYVMDVKSGKKFHSHTRCYRKTDNFCPLHFSTKLL